MGAVGVTRRTGAVLAIEIDMEGLDPEVAARVESRSVTLVTGAVAPHGGWLHAASGGRISVIFVPPFLHETPEVAATQAGIRLAGRFDGLDPARTPGWSIGIAAGELLGAAGGDAADLSGTPLVTAWSLVASARSSETVLGDEVRSALGSEIDAAPRPDGSWLLERARLQERAHRNLQLVGRESSMTTVLDAFEEVCTVRSARRVVVSGSPGLGKSRLIEVAADTLKERATIVSGYCDPAGRGLGPLGHALEQLVGPQRAGSLDERLSAFLPDKEERAVVVQHMAHVLGGPARPSSSENVLWGVRRVLEAAAVDRPLILVLEDLQWAGEMLLDAVEYLTGFIAAQPVLLLCSTRPELFVDRESFAATSATSRAIELSELTLEETRELVDLYLEGAPPDGLAEKVQGIAKGNPLYAIELIVQWGRAAAGGASPVDLVVPESMASLWETRISALDAADRTILECAAIVGGRFQIEDVAGLTGAESVSVLLHLARLTEQHLIERDPASETIGSDEFRFEHDLIRQTIYRMVGKAHRAQLHQDLAAWLRRTADAHRSEAIGYHLEQAVVLLKELSESPATVDHLAEQAARALVDGSRNAADAGDLSGEASMLRRALALFPEESSDWLTAAIELGDTLLQIGAYEEADALNARVIAAAEASPNPDDKARAALAAGSYLATTSPTPQPELIEQLGELVPVFEGTGDHRALTKLYLAVAECEWTSTRCQPVVDALGKGLKHALVAGAEQSLVRIAGFLLSTLILGPTSVADGMKACEHLFVVVGTDRIARARLGIAKGVFMALQGQFDTGRGLVREGRAIIRDAGLAVVAAGMSQWAAQIEMLAGEFHAAAHLLEDGLDEFEALDVPEYRPTSLAMLAQARYEAGDPRAAVAAAREALALGEGDVTLIPDTYPVLAHMAADQADRDGATRYLDDARAEVASLDTLLVQAYVAVETARVLVKLGDVRAAAAVADAHELCERKGAVALASRIPVLG